MDSIEKVEKVRVNCLPYKQGRKEIVVYSYKPRSKHDKKKTGYYCCYVSQSELNTFGLCDWDRNKLLSDDVKINGIPKEGLTLNQYGGKEKLEKKDFITTKLSYNFNTKYYTA